MDNNLHPTPVKNYTPPSLPTLKEANADLLQKAQPARWKKNAAVTACLGIAGMLTLAGCAELAQYRPHNGGAPEAPIYIAHPTETDAENARYHHGGEAYAPYYVTQLTEQEIRAQIQAQIEAAGLDLRVHWGGGGAGPFYVAHITEIEALAYIRARLEAAGLNLDATPPEYTIFGPDEVTPRPGMVGEKAIDLFDAENRVAVVRISWEDSVTPFSPQGRELANLIEAEFSDRLGDISFGVFNNPGHMVCEGRFFDAMWNDDDSDDIEDVTAEEKEAARYFLIRDLSAQVDEFIARLQAEGIV